MGESFFQRRKGSDADADAEGEGEGERSERGGGWVIERA